jgi:hypothetical protein
MMVMALNMIFPYKLFTTRFRDIFSKYISSIQGYYATMTSGLRDQMITAAYFNF